MQITNSWLAQEIDFSVLINNVWIATLKNKTTHTHTKTQAYGDINTHIYRNFLKYSDTQKICCNLFKIWTMWLYHRVMSPNDADRMANSVDPDQTAPPGEVWSGSALFAQTSLSENLGTLL